MKKTEAILATISLAALCLAQNKLNTITNATGSFILKFRDFSLTNPSGPVTHLVLTNSGGQVYAASKKQGIELYAPHLAIDAISTKGKENDAIRSAAASGGIRVIRTAQTGTSEMTGSSGNYSVDGDKGTLLVRGPVKLTNASGGDRSFAATGAQLTAGFDNSVSKTPLTTAVLSGGVDVTIRQAGSGGKPGSDIRLSASKLTLHQDAQPRRGGLVHDGGDR